MESFKFLKSSPAISDYKVIEFKSSQFSRYYKIVVIFEDDSILYAREYLSKNERNYSYHWQDKHNNLLIRWDNAPFHKNIKTYPHHKHVKDKLQESPTLTLDKVIEEIEKRISK